MTIRGVIIRNGDVYAPQHLGHADVTVVGGQVFSLQPDAWRELAGVKGFEFEQIDAAGGMVFPGLVDIHCHFGGAGGEGGPVYRTPPLQLSDLTTAGITTAIGLLGTDGCGRSLRELLLKARALDEEGVSTWIYTGSYQLPGPTLTGDVTSDLLLIDKVLGLKVAFSDHRASQSSVERLREYAAQSRVGGILAGKSGIVMVHIGEGEDRLEPLLRAARTSDIPLTQFVPTHLNRSRRVLEQAVRYVKSGGRVDVTSGVSERCFFPGAVKPSRAVVELLNAGVPIEHVTMSSDGNGVMTHIDERTGETQPLMAPVASLFVEFCDMIREGLPPETASRVTSANSADALRLGHGKGRLVVGGDADVIVLTPGLELKAVIARGKTLVNDGAVVKGLFER